MYAGSNSGQDVTRWIREPNDPLELRERRHGARRAIDRGRHPLLGIGLPKYPGTGNNKVFAFSLANEKDHGEHSGDNDHSDNHGGQN